jgi:hypothetical protein
MSIVIALIIVLVIGGLVANFYPKPNKTIVTAPEPEVELAPETFVVVEPLVETKVVVEETKVENPKVEAPKMDAKPKKKPQPKKKPTKAKVNA